MLIPADSLLALTYHLRSGEHALAAIEALRQRPETAACEGLVELLYAATPARVALAAIAALDGRRDRLVTDGLQRALRSEHASVRLAALQALHRRGAPIARQYGRCLRCDPSWTVRRAAVTALAEQPEPERWAILAATDDPHWRVRHALVMVLREWESLPGKRAEIIARIAERGDARADGVAGYLDWCWTGEPLCPSAVRGNADGGDGAAGHACEEFWDRDTAVLLRKLRGIPEARRLDAIDMLPLLVGHSDDRVRTLMLAALRRHGKSHHWLALVPLLGEPRCYAAAALLAVLDGLDADRQEAIVGPVLASGNSPAALTAWLLRHPEALPAEEWSALLLHSHANRHTLRTIVRLALVEALGRWNPPTGQSMLCEYRDDVDPEVLCALARSLQAHAIAPELHLHAFLRSPHADVRAEAARLALRCGADGPPLVALQTDAHPCVRAAALTPQRARELIADPVQETSWHVLAEAARLARVPLWKLMPEPAELRGSPAVAAAPQVVRWPAASTCTRPLGPQRLLVSRIGISGHYGLPLEGFALAVEAGVSLFFWEPNYHTLTDFFGRLPPSERRRLHVIAGTFEADGARVRRDAERALRSLGVERLAVFLVFWVQTWQRLFPDVLAALAALERDGLIAAHGLSTHSRPLAAEALARGWNPIMVRHSAAHRGAEETVFPAAIATGASVLTFNNTCYGRLLRPQRELSPPGAADCYRYSLSHPAVTACLCAPATLAELRTDLAALHDPELPAQRRDALLEQGALVYREDGMFKRLIRDR